MTTEVRPRLLTARNLTFAQEYVTNGHNGTNAALKAGASEKRAAITASEWLRVPAIQEHIAELDRRVLVTLARSEDKFILTAARILERAWQIAQSDSKDRVSALAVAAKAFPEFRDGPAVDARTVNLLLPEGTNLEDIRTLRDSLK